jgi:hypothetical protein
MWNSVSQKIGRPLYSFRVLEVRQFIKIKMSYSKPKILFLLGVAGRRQRCMLENNWSNTISKFHHILSSVGRATISGILFRLNT